MPVSRNGVAPRLLLADDDLDVREAMVDLLREEGFEVVEAASFDEATAQLERTDFQGVLSDFRMAGREEPWKALEQMVALAAPAPVGLLTAWPMKEEEARERGIAFLLTKPFDTETLFARVAEHVKTGPPDPERERRVHEYFDALSTRDWDRLASLCTEDVAYHLPGEDRRFSKTVKGRAEFREFSEATFREFPHARFEVDQVLALPGSMVARYSGDWVPAGGERQILSGSVLFHFRGELIAEIGVRLNLEQLTVVS